MIRILSIVWYKVLPAQFGGQKGIAHFQDSLAQHAPLTCLCSADNEPPQGLSYNVLPLLPAGKWQFILPRYHRLIKATALQEKPSHILLEHPYHGYAAIKAARTCRASLIVHAHNIEFIRFRQIGKWWWKLLYYFEKWVYSNASLSIFKTEEDKQEAIRYFNLPPEKCMILPYGVTRPVKNENAKGQVRQKHGIAATTRILLFAGTLDYEPNADAVTYIYNTLAPQLSATDTDYRIIICGRNRFPAFQYLRRLKHPHVTYAGEVENIGDYFSAADVFINPVQTGGGIQTKNIDALSYDLDVVCFNNMLAGIHTSVCGDKALAVAPGDPAAFINMIVHGIERKRLATPAIFFEHYSFNGYAEKLVARLNSP